jgi:hypothetical protein
MSIEVIKQALEALEMYLKLDTMDEAHILEVEIAPKAITALRAAIEQAEKQEPVAWQGVHDHTDLYYRKPPQADVRPLYTTPPVAPRQWVGLTAEEINALYIQHHNQFGECLSGDWGYERDLEAKLKEKNT